MAIIVSKITQWCAVTIETGFLNDYIPSKTIRNWTSVLYLSGLSSFIFPLGNIIVPLVIWLLKKEEHTYIDTHGKEVLNFQITLFVVAVVVGLLLLVLGGIAIATHAISLAFNYIPVFAFLTVIVASFGIINLIMMIMGAIKANSGKTFKLPLTFSFIK